ncbi:MAG: DNA polymerase III subunit alpha [Bacteroidales bacterium]|jgi:DNA polymerase-3 subunit alpha
MSNFVHLHVHTQYSVLDGFSEITKLLQKAKDLGMPSIAITDHGNMYGAVNFYNAAKKIGIKPIIGMEAYVADGSRFEKDKGRDQDTRIRGYHLVILAKNFQGYRNLCKLSSYGFTEGFYYNARIDKELLEKYSEGLIVSSACLAGEIPYFINLNNMERVEESILWYKKVFKDDFYLELMDHGIPEQKKVNETLLELSKKFDVKLIATNDVHFIDKEDRIPHDILVCINTQADYDSPTRLRYSGEEYLKAEEEMSELFSYAPEAITNTLEISEKVEEYSILRKNVILPTFPIPENMKDEDDYLKVLTFEGAEKRYKEVTPDIKERLNFELSVIKQMGFPGYFLIVQDFINYAKKEGVYVGPGRGSAAGSAVAYCIGITDIDPIKYNLLFERFLNPERVTMPDIDVDFDDVGREKVLKYVVDKYHKDHVAQIVTIGKMASKSAIRDVGRVLKLPLNIVDSICNKFPDRDVTIEQAVNEDVDFAKLINDSSEEVKTVIHYASKLEGSIRQTGVHACGVIIGPEDLTNYVPIANAKDSDLVVTQFEGAQVESVGMLKMDFLGLKTLSIIISAIDNIYRSKNIKIDIDNIPENDPKAFELFQQGATTGIFQFESPGMQKYLRELHPENIEDLIAMNALYRPGPMDNIPSFIDRKQGREKIEYPHELLEDILKPTYGIMVYQEQIMQAAQRCAGFSLGKADILRRAMGKKKVDVMASMKAEFIEGCKKTNNIDEKKATEIFEIMEKFASYGFNRSHSAAYALIAYITAYLKGNYPAEFMAAVLTNNQRDIKKITALTDECQRMKLNVLGPDINSSRDGFAVNHEGNIVFGLAAISGVGNAAVDAIVSERDANGEFKDILDFVFRVDQKSVTKANIEALAATGAFDKFEDFHRAQILSINPETGTSYANNLVKYGADLKRIQNTVQISLFGEEQEKELLEFKFPEVEKLTLYQKLKLEKKFLGMYVSGYPLDQYKVTLSTCANSTLSNIKELIENQKTSSILYFGALVSDVNIRRDKRENEYARFTLEDYDSSMNFFAFSEQFLKLKPFLIQGLCVLVSGSVAYRNRGEDIKEYYFKISEMHMLDSVLEKFVKKINLSVDLDEINKVYVDQLEADIKECSGKCPLKLFINDKANNYYVELESTNKLNPKLFAEKCKEQNYKVIFNVK